MRVTARALAATGSRQTGDAVRQRLAGTARGGGAARHTPRRERDVQAAILEALRKLPGVVAWKSGAGAFRVDGRFVKMGHKGVSDIIGWRKVTPVLNVSSGQFEFTVARPASMQRRCAQFLAIEVKAKGKAPTDEQRAFLDAVTAAGGIGIVAYEVQDVLKALGVTNAEYVLAALR